MEMIRVKIINCNNGDRWYSDKIGGEYLVFSMVNTKIYKRPVYLVEDDDLVSAIDVLDCEIID